jgi:hypothetical protein
MREMADDIKFPKGTVILDGAQPDPDAAPNVELALDLAAHGASVRLVRSVGGDEAVRLVEIAAANGHAAA